MGSVETRAFAFVVVKWAAKVNDRLSRRRKQLYIHHWLFWIGCHFNKNSTPLERHPNAQKILKLWTMSVHQYLERRFQDLMKFVERLPRLFLYFGPQRAVEQDDEEGKFRQEPVYKLGGRAVPFLSDSVRLHHLLMRANVTNGQTFGGNSWQINFANISKLSTPQWKTNHSILRLAEYRFIFEKIDWLNSIKMPRHKLEKTLERLKVPILKNKVEIHVVSNLRNSWPFIYTILPDSNFFRNRSKVTSYLSMCYTK